MKKVIFFDPTVGTTNLGDYIIMLSIKRHIHELFANDFVIKLPTRLPLLHFYQKFKKNILYRTIINADIKLICGTNLLYTNLFRPWPLLNINLFDVDLYKGSILIGVGCGVNSKKSNLYTEYIYKKILRKDVIHSVRDEYTKNFVESLGFQAINTGCPTLWSLDDNFCKSVVTQKSEKVVFTLTDYSKDIEKDSLLISKLKYNYKKVYFWPQGIEDFNYLCYILNGNLSDIQVIPPKLEAFKNILQEGDIDYVGTRLHAGIFALQHKIRTIIISVDYRSSYMSVNFGLPIYTRDNIAEIDAIINNNLVVSNIIKRENIDRWLQQFHN